MARKLVVCCDGTWNTPRNETNVFRTYRFLRERLGLPAEVTLKDGVVTCGSRAGDGGEVLLFYDRGVGTDWLARIVGVAARASASRTTSGTRTTSSATTSSRAARLTCSGSPAARTRPARSAGSSRPPGSSSGRARRTCGEPTWTATSRRPGWSPSPPAGARDRVRGWLVERAGDAVGRRGGGPDVASLPRHRDVSIRFIGVIDTVGALGVPLGGAGARQRAHRRLSRHDPGRPRRACRAGLGRGRQAPWAVRGRRSGPRRRSGPPGGRRACSRSGSRASTRMSAWAREKGHRRHHVGLHDAAGGAPRARGRPGSALASPSASIPCRPSTSLSTTRGACSATG